MFCPSCGVKNDGQVLRCFVCGKTIPTADMAARLSAAESALPRVVQVRRMESLGSIGDRMLALLFDRALLLAVAIVPLAAAAGRWSEIEDRLVPGAWIAIAAVVAISVVFAYHLLFEGAFGATLGKAIFGLHVTNESERGRFAAAAIRNGFRLVDSLAFYGAGFLVALFSSRKRRLGDIAAGTVVIEQPVHWAARAGLILLWLALIASALWAAHSICPACVPVDSLLDGRL